MKIFARIHSLLLLVLGLAVIASLTGLGAAGAARERESATRFNGPYRNGLIAYARCCGRPSTGIFTIRPDGSHNHSIFRPRGDDAPLTPAWSPDGTKIAYAPGLPQGGIWAMRTNGTGRHRITRGNYDFPTWSPKGNWLAFTGARDDIYRVRLDGSGLKRLTRSAAVETRPVWAPNRGEIAYVRGARSPAVWVMDTTGRHQRRLAENADSPTWSPGGSRIAFVRDNRIWVMHRDGSGPRLMVDVPAQSVVWSPDGRWIIASLYDRADLMLVRTDGTRLHPLTHQAGLFNGWPSWQRLPAR